MTEIDPADKATIDAVIEVNERARAVRAWRFWMVVALSSLAALWCVRYDALSDVVRLALAILGGVGLLLFLVFISTKRYGRGWWAGPDFSALFSGCWW